MAAHDFIHTWGWLGVVIIWAVWTLIVFGVGWLIAYQLRPHRPSHEPGRPEEDPLTILKRRYARGELTPEQFEKMKRDLESSPSAQHDHS